jgi:hypothetical protein
MFEFAMVNSPACMMFASFNIFRNIRQTVTRNQSQNWVIGPTALGAITLYLIDPEPWISES